jgi:WD40 repeat protein
MTTDASAASTSRRYAMFISYRHADNLEMGRKWATWLHETVENYEIPADLIGKSNLRGETVPASLYPVFRDEEELPADADLSTNIRRALENSGLLVVLCSPRAVQSRFVADEIRYFKELGKSGRILALMIDGEPNASDDPEKLARLGAEAECFPEPLRFGVPDELGNIDWSARTEPIAADCRPGGRPEQGWTTAAAYEEWLEKQAEVSRSERTRMVREYTERLELAKLKVIAGALGVPLGELTQRDKARQLLRAKRRARLLTSLSVVFAILAGAAGLLGWLANEKRKDADAQRLEADRQRNEANTQRQQADTQRKAAEEAKGVAENEKRQAVATLAASDFQEGVNRLAKPATARAGLAFLARSARAGHESAGARIWSLFQQMPFWIPDSNNSAPPVCEPHLVNRKPPEKFATVILDGQKVEPTWYAESADGIRCVTVVSAADAGEGPITFRVWETSGNPLGGWRSIDYKGDTYLSGIVSATLSDDGRFVAVIASPWREPQFLEVWDVDKGVRVGDPIPAEGGHPNYQGAVFNDVWFTPADKNGIGMLVTLSSRGDASVFRYDADLENPTIWKHAVNAHDQPVSLAVMDAERHRFASVAVDRSVRVLDLTAGEPVGWPLQASGVVTGLALEGPNRVSLRLDDGKGASWKLFQPAKAAPAAQTKLVLTGDKALQKDFDGEGESNKSAAVTADQQVGKALRILGGSDLEWIDTTKPGNPALWRRRFPAAIAHARFCGEDCVLVQTGFFGTEIWDVKTDAPVHPAIDESALFTADHRSDTPLLSSLSPDGKLVLTRSFFWNPPNCGIHAFTVWDAATGKTVSDPIRVVDDGLTDPPGPNHAEFSADGNHLLLGVSADSEKPDVTMSLQLRPPAAITSLLPDLAEALGGLRLKPDGGLEPVSGNPAEVIGKLRDAAGR